MMRITKTILGEEVTVFWNHRVMRRIEHGESLLYVVEVFYRDDDGSILGWTERESVWTTEEEGVDSLRQTLHWMLDALDKPILDEAELLAQARAARERGEEPLFSEPVELFDSADELLESLRREDIEDDS